MIDPTPNPKWAAAAQLDRAMQYLASDAGERNIDWTADLQDACDILRKLDKQLRTAAVREAKKMKIDSATVQLNSEVKL